MNLKGNKKLVRKWVKKTRKGSSTDSIGSKNIDDKINGDMEEYILKNRDKSLYVDCSEKMDAKT